MIESSSVAIDSKSVPELRIILVHAGATELDAQGRITGTLDLPMCGEAEEQIKLAAAQLSFVSMDAIYAADCDSAKKTAECLTKDRRLKVRVSPMLTNLDCGLWHGKRIEEVKQTQPKMFRKWAEMSGEVCPPNGESLADARARVRQFLIRLRKKHSKGTVAVVAPQPLLSVLHGLLDPGAIPRPWTKISESGKWDSLSLGSHEPFGAFGTVAASVKSS